MRQDRFILACRQFYRGLAKLESFKQIRQDIVDQDYDETKPKSSQFGRDSSLSQLFPRRSTEYVSERRAPLVKEESI